MLHLFSFKEVDFHHHRSPSQKKNRLIHEIFDLAMLENLPYNMIKTSKKYQLALDGLEEGCHLHPPSEIHLLRETLANAMLLGCDPPPHYITNCKRGKKTTTFHYTGLLKGFFINLTINIQIHPITKCRCRYNPSYIN